MLYFAAFKKKLINPVIGSYWNSFSSAELSEDVHVTSRCRCFTVFVVNLISVITLLLCK